MLCIYIFETGCHYVAMTNLELKYVDQASLPLTEILLLPLKGWDEKYMPACLANDYSLNLELLEGMGRG